MQLLHPWCMPWVLACCVLHLACTRMHTVHKHRQPQNRLSYHRCDCSFEVPRFGSCVTSCSKIWTCFHIMHYSCCYLMIKHMDSHAARVDMYVSHAEKVQFLFNAAGKRRPREREKQMTWEKTTKHWAEKATGRERAKETERPHAEAHGLLTTQSGRKPDGCTNTQTHTQTNRITHARRDARREGN